MTVCVTVILSLFIINSQSSKCWSPQYHNAYCKNNQNQANMPDQIEIQGRDLQNVPEEVLFGSIGDLTTITQFQNAVRNIVDRLNSDHQQYEYYQDNGWGDNHLGLIPSSGGPQGLGCDYVPSACKTESKFICKQPEINANAQDSTYKLSPPCPQSPCTVSDLADHEKVLCFYSHRAKIMRKIKPTNNPTKSPTKKPTKSPMKSPTKKPTKNPTKKPTTNPTKNPTENPTVAIPQPTKSPTPFCEELKQCWNSNEWGDCEPHYTGGQFGNIPGAEEMLKSVCQCYYKGETKMSGYGNEVLIKNHLYGIKRIKKKEENVWFARTERGDWRIEKHWIYPVCPAPQDDDWKSNLWY